MCLCCLVGEAGGTRGQHRAASEVGGRRQPGPGTRAAGLRGDHRRPAHPGGEGEPAQQPGDLPVQHHPELRGPAHAHPRGPQHGRGPLRAAQALPGHLHLRCPVQLLRLTAGAAAAAQAGTSRHTIWSTVQS